MTPIEPCARCGAQAGEGQSGACPLRGHFLRKSGPLDFGPQVFPSFDSALTEGGGAQGATLAAGCTAPDGAPRDDPAPKGASFHVCTPA